MTITDTEDATYGWIVTQDHEHDRDPLESDALGISCRVGTIGPRNLRSDIQDALTAGKGRAWRTLYDNDGAPLEERVTHEGRYLDLHDLGICAVTELDGDEEFGPLNDLSAPDVGAVEIEYRTARGWQQL